MNILTRKLKKPGDRPYTKAEAEVAYCYRCNNICGPNAQQWQICALDNKWYPICPSCDVELNRTVLEFMGFTKSFTNYFIDLYAQRFTPEEITS